MGHLNNIYSKSGKREIVIHTRKDGSRWTHIFGSPSVGAKPFEPLSDWMTEWTRSRVECLTVPVSLSTALTVALDTPASRATSLMVG